METTIVTTERALCADEATRILHWRIGQLERTGYTADEAIRLARRTDVDLHRAIELVQCGCPTQTALRILL